MKKLFGIIALVAFFSIPQTALYAAIQVNVLSQDVLLDDKVFTVDLKGVNRITDTNVYRFDFKTNSAVNKGIQQWEIRMWCEDGITVSFNKKGVDQCNSGNITVEQTPDFFSIFLTKSQINKRTNFSFKLKAFGADGRWLHSEKRAFIW